MMTLNEIIGFMSPELANEILDDTFKEDKQLYKALSAEVAGALKLRPLFFEQKPRNERNKIILDMLTRPRMQASAATLLRGWLVKSEAGMLADFLDTIGIEHKNGVVEDFPETVDETKVNAAVDKLLEKYPQEKVLVYLNSFSAMNDAPWEALSKRLKDDKRLQLA
ncbi:MAG TPA: hypothetical protein VM735_04510 [Candidatus Kapabacteria bacterium]|nr:hypothetical protein [Candidatus Kapabacteria bacterium]